MINVKKNQEICYKDSKSMAIIKKLLDQHQDQGIYSNNFELK